MIKNEDIICISSIDWDFIWQGHQEIMTRLARNGNRVLFIENTGVRTPNFRDLGRIKSRISNWKRGIHGIRKIENGLYVYSPIVLPFPYWKVARFINKRLMFSVLFKWLKVVGFSEPVVWVFLPTGLSLDLINELDPKALIYYCIDSFQASSKDARKIKATEEKLIRQSDLVFATSDKLLNYCKQYNDKVYYFPFGVNLDNFLSVRNKDTTTPKDMTDVKKPVAGYIGGIHKWIDFDLLKHVISYNKDVSFVFCGPVQVNIDKLKGLPNVKFLGQKKTEELPAYVREFDIALIPYRITDYTRNVYPTKLNEYLSLGKRVVSTNLPEVRKFNAENDDIVRVANTQEEFSEIIRNVVHKPAELSEKKKAVETAKNSSWAIKLEAMSGLISDEMDRKINERERSWKDNLSKIYKGARKGLLPIAVSIGVAYVALFHTPLIWFAASPLKIENTPVKSDVIAVLGGGVGESGEAGQGYEERVDTAVKLYKNGFAEKIIYSSGFKYIMKEAQVMKALSVFMGVAEKAIILDDNPINTYEMIKDLKAMAEAKGWKKIILISSPYHMRRLKLLCDKELKGIIVYYVPVEQSSFYAHRRRVSIKQLKGIVQEYIAIMYYKMKGYV